MTCREIVEFLLKYLSRDLPPSVHAGFEEHLGACPSCRAYLATYSDTIRLAHECLCEEATGAAVLPPDLVEAIRRSRRGALQIPGRVADEGLDDGAGG